MSVSTPQHYLALPLLADATNTQTACLRHSPLHEDSTVYAQVRAWVRPTAAPVVLAVAAAGSP